MNLSAENTTTAKLIIKNTNVTVRLIPTSSAVMVLHFTVINQANVLDIKKMQYNYPNTKIIPKEILMKINDLFKIEGKTAIVTGGSRGIGEMITAGFLANGVKVYITARKATALIEKAKELSEKYRLQSHRCGPCSWTISVRWWMYSGRTYALQNGTR